MIDDCHTRPRVKEGAILRIAFSGYGRAEAAVRAGDHDDLQAIRPPDTAMHESSENLQFSSDSRSWALSAGVVFQCRRSPALLPRLLKPLGKLARRQSVHEGHDMPRSTIPRREPCRAARVNAVVLFTPKPGLRYCKADVHRVSTCCRQQVTDIQRRRCWPQMATTIYTAINTTRIQLRRISLCVPISCGHSWGLHAHRSRQGGCLQAVAVWGE